MGQISAGGPSALQLFGSADWQLLEAPLSAPSGNTLIHPSWGLDQRNGADLHQLDIWFLGCNGTITDYTSLGPNSTDSMELC